METYNLDLDEFNCSNYDKTFSLETKISTFEAIITTCNCGSHAVKQNFYTLNYFKTNRIT